MKKARLKKVLGVVLGEKSLLAAEIIAGEQSPQVKRLAEMVYPEGITLSQPAELAKAMAHFLKDNEIGSRVAVIGIPLKWIVVKPKEVPPADDVPRYAQLLRLEAEAEFSVELKDLVYDFARRSRLRWAGATRNVLLAATPKEIYRCDQRRSCEGARLQPLAITSVGAGAGIGDRGIRRSARCAGPCPSARPGRN